MKNVVKTLLPTDNIGIPGLSVNLSTLTGRSVQCNQVKVQKQNLGLEACCYV